MKQVRDAQALIQKAIEPGKVTVCKVFNHSNPIPQIQISLPNSNPIILHLRLIIPHSDLITTHSNLIISILVSLYLYILISFCKID